MPNPADLSPAEMKVWDADAVVEGIKMHQTEEFEMQGAEKEGEPEGEEPEGEGPEGEGFGPEGPEGAGPEGEGIGMDPLMML